jgi:hypothetical protein
VGSEGIETVLAHALDALAVLPIELSDEANLKEVTTISDPDFLI